MWFTFWEFKEAINWLKRAYDLRQAIEEADGKVESRYQICRGHYYEVGEDYAFQLLEEMCDDSKNHHIFRFCERNKFGSQDNDSENIFIPDVISLYKMLLNDSPYNKYQISKDVYRKYFRYYKNCTDYEYAIENLNKVYKCDTGYYSLEYGEYSTNVLFEFLHSSMDDEDFFV